MPSVLIYGATIKNRKEILLELCNKLGIESIEDSIDTRNIVLEDKKKSIGIEQIRELKKFLQEKPITQKNKIAIIEKAHLLTIQAQNALLKTLEEPPQYAHIFLLTKTEEDLLETVVSRCKRIKVKQEEGEKSKYNIFEILHKSQGEKLSIASKINEEEKEQVIDILENWVKDLRINMSITNADNISEILRIKESIEKTNVSVKLALENLLLKVRADS